jgi:hypothetical protein
MPVYDKQGKWLGKIDAVDTEKENASFQSIRTKETVKLKKKDFSLAEGKIILSSGA